MCWSRFTELFLVKKQLHETADQKSSGIINALVRSLGRLPGEGNGNPRQYPCLENPINRRAWQATVHRITESDMTYWLTFHFYLRLSELMRDILLWLFGILLIVFNAWFFCIYKEDSPPPFPVSLNNLIDSFKIPYIYVLLYCTGVYLSGLLHSI